MSAQVLEDLKSDEFELSVGFLSTAGTLRRFLGGTREIAAVRQALKEGAITEDAIRRFISALLQDLRVGNRLPYEIAVAALAVALETRATDFAEEYLHDLSRLKLAEMSLCIRVARECRRNRTRIARRAAKTFSLRGPEAEQPYRVQVSGWTSRRNGHEYAGQTTAILEVFSCQN